jgi:hypothetical protein
MTRSLGWPEKGLSERELEMLKDEVERAKKLKEEQVADNKALFGDNT